MRRYEGSGLPANPRVAVIANDAIGNFVVATPLLQALRRELSPCAIHYFGGRRTAELQSASTLFEQSFLLHGRELSETLDEVKDSYDLIVNVEQGELARQCVAALAGEAYVCGPVDGLPFQSDDRGDLWRDREWISPELCHKYPFLDSPWIAEIYVRLCYLNGPVPKYLVPTKQVDHDLDVLVATTASLPEKLWNFESWAALVDQLSARGLRVGLLGAPPKVQGQHWKGADEESRLVEETELIDCRGRWTLPEVVGAIDRARAVVSLDNGIMHLAASTPTPVVALFRFGIHRLWTPPVKTVVPIVAESEASVASIPIRDVLEAVARVL